MTTVSGNSGSDTFNSINQGILFLAQAAQLLSPSSTGGASSLGGTTAPTLTRRPDPGAEYAPNGFETYPVTNRSTGVQVGASTLNSTAQNAVLNVFAVSGNPSGGSSLTPFDPRRDSTGGTQPNALSFVDMDRLLGSAWNNAGGAVDNNVTNASFAAIGRTEIGNVYSGHPMSNPEQVTAAQEVAHNILKSHPDLKGKVQKEDSEVVGEAVSLKTDPAYASVLMRNALLSQSGVEPQYAKIEANAEKALDTMASKYGFTNGAQFMQDYLNFVATDPSSSRTGTRADLENFVKTLKDPSGAAVNPQAFNADLQTALTTQFESEAKNIIQTALRRPNVP